MRKAGPYAWTSLLIAVGLLAGGCPMRPSELAANVKKGKRIYEDQAALSRDTQALVHFTNAQQQALDGRDDLAVVELEAALAADPDSAYLHEMLAYLLFQQGRHDEARKAIADSIKLDGQRPTAFLVQGLIMMEQEQFAPAEASFLAASQLDPDDPDYVINRADAQFRQGKLEEGLATLSEHAALHPEELLVRYYKALVLMNTGEIDQARSEYEAILDISPSYYLALNDLLRLELAANRRQEAIAVGYALIDFYPSELEGRLLLASALAEGGDEAEALRVLEEGKTAGQLDPVWWNRKGFLLFKLKRLSEAREEFDSALALEPANEEAVYGLALVSLEEGDRAGASAYFESIPPSSGVYVSALRMLAMLAFQDDQPQVALGHAGAAFKAQPQNLDAVLLASWALRESGDYEKAGKLMEAANKKWPAAEGAWMERALILSGQGKREEAVALMNQYLEQRPDSAAALNFIGYLWAEDGVRLDEAEALIDRALVLEPEAGYILDSRGWVYYKRGDYEKALEWLTKADAAMADDPEILEHLGDCHRALGDLAKAREIYGRALKAATSVEGRKRLRAKLEEVK